MHPTSPFPQLIPARIHALIPRVRNLIWHNRRPLEVEVTQATETHYNQEEIRGCARRLTLTGESWGRLFDQRWARLDLSSAEPGDYLQWGDQGEATLHINGIPHYGFDPEHTHCPLPVRTVKEAWVECYCCRTHWVAGDMLSAEGSQFRGAWLVSRNDHAWHAFHDLQCLADLAFYLRDSRAQGSGTGLDTAWHYPPLDSAPPLYRQLLRHLDRAADAFDTGGLSALQPVLTAAYQDLHEASPRLRARFIGGSHLDLVYLWPEAMGEAKAVHTFATVNRLLELYPEFQFSYSQPASYEAVARRAPSLMESVRSHIAQGRWEPTGALYVESDLQIACGEALARSFVLGQAAFETLRGSVAKVLWLPDCFGYPNCIPAIARLAGVEHFFTAKLAWSSINRFPYSSFLWRGADGSELLAHIPRAGGYSDNANVEKMHAAANSHVQADIHREFIHAVGFGDGGGGPTESLIERARRFASLSGMPAVSWDQPEAFFERLAPLRPQLPVWKGELYLEYHRGTATTQGAMKASYRNLERTLQIREALAVSTGESPNLTAAWKRLVMHQFHDDIPGTAVPEVYAESIADLNAQAEALSGEIASLLSKEEGGELCAFNPHPLPWAGWIRTEDGAYFVELPPMGAKALVDKSDVAQPPLAPASARESTNGQWFLENGRILAAIAGNGSLASLEIDGVPIELLPGAGLPVIYPDYPANYDAWDIDRHTLALGRLPAASTAMSAPTNYIAIKVTESGGSRAVISVHHPLGNKNNSSITLHYQLDAGSSVLRIEAELDWHEPQALLKLVFPTAYQGRLARFGAPFGSTLRGQHPGQPEVEAQWEACGSRWAAVAHDGDRNGLALITEAKYGFSIRDGELGVSLVRSPLQTGYQSHGALTPRDLSRHECDSPYSDLGHHTIRLALARLDVAAHRASQPAALAETLFTLPVSYKGRPIPSPFAGLTGDESLVPVWAMPLDDRRWVLRLHEVAGQSGQVRLPEALHAAGAQAVDLLLNPIPDKQQLAPDGLLQFRPYEIISLLINPVQ